MLATEIKEQIELNFGIDTDSVEEVNFQLDTLRETGILVDLDITGVSLFARRATWLELGIIDADSRRERFTRGQKYLVPEDIMKQLNSITTRMRQLFDKSGRKITGFSPWLWVPYTVYSEFKSNWEGLLSEFNSIKAEILDNRDNYADKLAADFMRVAEDAWVGLQAQAAKNEKVMIPVIDHVAYPDLDSFTDIIISRAMKYMPTADEIEMKLKADYRVSIITTQIDIEAQRLETERLRNLRRQEAEEAHARQRETYLQTHLLERQNQHQEEMIRLEEAEKRLKIESMLKAEQDHYYEQMAQTVSPLQEIMDWFVSEIAESLEAISESVRKNGHLRGKTAEKAAGLMEFYKAYEPFIAGDKVQLRNALIDLKEHIGPIGKGGSDRDIEKIEASLTEVSNLTKDLADAARRGPSRASVLEI